MIPTRRQNISNQRHLILQSAAWKWLSSHAKTIHFHWNKRLENWQNYSKIFSLSVCSESQLLSDRIWCDIRCDKWMSRTFTQHCYHKFSWTIRIQLNKRWNHFNQIRMLPFERYWHISVDCSTSKNIEILNWILRMVKIVQINKSNTLNVHVKVLHLVH